MKTIPYQDDPRRGRWMFSFIIVCLAFAISVGTFGCWGDDPTEPEPDPPVIRSVSKTVVSPGDTITITGEKFATSISGNRVTFNNSVGSAYPYFASAAYLHVVVPENAATGPMTVTSRSLKSNAVTIEVQRGIGDVWVMGGAGSVYNFKVPNPTGSAKYLVVPHSATSVRRSSSYIISPGTTSVFPSSREKSSGRDEPIETIVERFEKKLRQSAIDYLKSNGAGKRFSPKKVTAQGPPDTTSFFVLNTISGDFWDPSSYSSVTSALRFVGSNTLIYSDINNPAGGFNQMDYDSIGNQFDTQIYPTDVGAFGPETDIDGNKKVVVLFSRVVNELTPPGQASSGFIAGFVNYSDMGPGIFPAGTTNGMEIFYVLVPDPMGDTGNTFPKSKIQTVARETIAHEFQHLISIGYRFVTLGGGTRFDYVQVTWLEEGMAHIAEDLNGMNSSNILRANLYLNDPGVISLMGLDDDDNSLPLRGGIYLFLRYLGDFLGNSIYKNILRNSYVGQKSVEHITGENFFLSVADFFAALYLSNNGAVPHDIHYDFLSISYPDSFAAIPVTSRSVSQGQFSGGIRNAAADYYIIENISTSALNLTVRGEDAGSKMRVVVTRIQ